MDGKAPNVSDGKASSPSLCLELLDNDAREVKDGLTMPEAPNVSDGKASSPSLCLELLDNDAREVKDGPPLPEVEIGKAPNGSDGKACSPSPGIMHIPQIKPWDKKLKGSVKNKRKQQILPLPPPEYDPTIRKYRNTSHPHKKGRRTSGIRSSSSPSPRSSKEELLMTGHAPRTRRADTNTSKLTELNKRIAQNELKKRAKKRQTVYLDKLPENEFKLG